MTTWPFVTVGCPTRDRLPFVADLLAQWGSQDYPGERELVFLDNGGASIAPLVAAAGDARIRVLTAPPGMCTLGELWNQLAAAARGEVFALWDDDDWHAPGYLLAMVGAMLAAPTMHGAILGEALRCQLLPEGQIAWWPLVWGSHDATIVIWRRHWENCPPWNTREKNHLAFGSPRGPVEPRPHPLVHVIRPDLYLYRIHRTNQWATKGIPGLTRVPYQNPPAIPGLPPTVDEECGILTASDAGYWPQTRLMLESLREVCAYPATVVDLGLDPAAYRELAELGGVSVQVPPRDWRRLVPGPDRDGPLWIKPFLLAASPYPQTAWIDSDCILVESPAPLFRFARDRFYVVRETFRPEHNLNPPELYERAPLPWGLEPTYTRIQAGVLGIHPAREARLLATWRALIRRAARDPALAALIRWWDQGALAWSLHALDMLECVALDTRWNTPAGSIRPPGYVGPERARFRAGPELTDQIRRGHPGAGIVHFMGTEKLTSLLDGLPAAPARPIVAPGPPEDSARGWPHRLRRPVRRQSGADVGAPGGRR